MTLIQEREELIACGIFPSRPRVAILNYLHNHHTHPTADEIFRSLRETVPTLSLTTVYNTLRLFADKGVCLSLTINEKQVCYDVNTMPHGHFLCSRCGKVYDIPCENEFARPGMSSILGHRIAEVHYYYKGICAECLEIEEKTNANKSGSRA